MNEVLRSGLIKLEMLSDEDQLTGLVHVQNAKNMSFSTNSVEEIIAVENADNYGAHYVYFRRFENRPSIPQVYIYDFTEDNGISEEKYIELHKRLYSSGHVPLFFVFTKKDVRIFNCFEKPAKGNQLVYKPLATILLAAKISELIDNENSTAQLKYFSGKSFDNGAFWEDSPYSKEFQFHKSAYEQLLTELKQALKDIIDQQILPPDIARKIMVISILIKYLEERKDENNNSVFPKAGQDRILMVNGRRQKTKYTSSFFDQFSSGAENFTDVLKEKGAGLKLFDYLARHFNGGVFQLSSQERLALEECDLSRFGLFLEGKLHGVQYVFWRLYSFNDLPVELISNIYEEFLEKKPGVVYTPPYLVSFLLDESMPLNGKVTDYKVLDPACGSGVFLVGAYRRLIYRWRQQHKWNRPSLEILKKLLKDNIFGSDKDAEAVNLTIFSLSLALCDELTPLQIWEDLEFDDLHNENLFSEDFFQLILDRKLADSSFDLVIGNPPFEAKLTAAAKAVETEQLKNRYLLTKVGDKEKKLKITLPDNQISLLFLEQVISLCKPGKLVCLIQPSGPLLYNNTSLMFRQYLLRQYHVPQIVDFTHISRVLFGKNGDVATAAVFVKNEPAVDRSLLHITVRRTKPNKEKIYFDLDTYDFNYVPRRLALQDPNIWKSNFLGGGRYHQLLQKFRGRETIGSYLDHKCQNQGWAVGEGFIIGNLTEIAQLKRLNAKPQEALTKEDAEILTMLRKKYKRASYLTNQPTLATGGLSVKGIDTNTISIQEQDYFIAPREGAIYKPPHVLVKEVIEDQGIPIALSTNFLTFKDSIVGIHAPAADIEELTALYNYLQNKAIIFYLAFTSAEFMVNRSSSILKKDLDNLPFLTDKSEFAFTEHEQLLIDDFWNYLLEFRRCGETSLIAAKNVEEPELGDFARIFCDVLNTVYNNLKPHRHFETDSYICYPFYFDHPPVIEFDIHEEAEIAIEKLVIKTTGTALRLTRVVRIYEGNVIYLIKPKKLRYWLRSVALRDADETFADLKKQGF